MTTLWKCDPDKLPSHNGKNIKVPGPLFDLEALQALLRSGALDLEADGQFWVGTDRCWNHLAQLKWTASHVAKLILALRPATQDYRNSEWAQDSDEDWHPCDSYAVRIDEGTFKRNRNAPKYYIKFSLDEYGSLYLVLLSCHLEQFR